MRSWIRPRYVLALLLLLGALWLPPEPAAEARRSCPARCRAIARKCKRRCKAMHPNWRPRRACYKRCKARQHRCRLRCG